MQILSASDRVTDQHGAGFVVETPALVVWRPAFDANRKALQIALSTLPSKVAVRAHCKAHKSGAVAKIQTLEDGCIGVCAQKLSEAEVMVEADIADILVSNEIAVTAFKTDRLSALLQRAIARGGTKKVSVCVDAVEQVLQLRTASERSNFPGGVGAMIELDVGHHRCGVDSVKQVQSLCEAIANTNGHVYLAGLQAYNGLIQHIRDPAERATKSKEICDKVRETKEALKQKGYDIPLVTGAGTGSFMLEGASGVYDEVQPGSYLWMDADYSQNPDTCLLFRHSLFIACSVMSTAGGTAGGPQRLVLDAGMKGIDFVCGPPRIAGIARGDSLLFLSLEEAAAYVVQNAGDEHCICTRNSSATSLPDICLGDTILLIPSHCDPQVGLYDFFTVLAPAEGEAEAARVLDGEGEEKKIRVAVQDIWKINRSVGF